MRRNVIYSSHEKQVHRCGPPTHQLLVSREDSEMVPFSWRSDTCMIFYLNLIARYLWAEMP